MRLAERVVALHDALAAAGLPHAFGGALALAYWTEEPRGTRDIDVNVFVPATDAARVLAALPDGVAIPDGTAAVVARDGQVRLWWDDTPVDLFFDYAPIHVRAARERRTVPFGGRPLPVLGPVELVVFKAAFDRTRDWADIEAVLAHGATTLDELRPAVAAVLGDDDPRVARLAEAARRAGAADG